MKTEEKINELITIVKQVVHEQATCEVSGGDWGVKLLNQLDELLKTKTP